jgi:hypothetical protein
MEETAGLLAGNYELRRRVLALSHVRRMQGSHGDLCPLERRRAEAFFWFALARRTWWHLSTGDRLAIEAVVRQSNPKYQHAPGSLLLESACVSLIRQILTTPSVGEFGYSH